jgi:heterodisulfide reductase subunit C2
MRQQIKGGDMKTAAIIELNNFAGKPAVDYLVKVQDMVSACMQCGTCTGSCPNAQSMDYTPRQLWRMVLLGQKDSIFASKTFSVCSSCYYCTLRCPRGLALTEAMASLKQLAAMENEESFRQSARFYESFLESVRRHGKVRELEMMNLYFIAMRNPLIPLKYAGLGIRLMRKRKIPLHLPSKGVGALDKIFRKVQELEDKS